MDIFPPFVYIYLIHSFEKAAVYSILWINLKLFIQSPIDFHLQCFQPLAIIHGADTLFVPFWAQSLHQVL